jgi:hypothetical protein
VLFITRKAYLHAMHAKAIVGGKLIRFRFSPELARAHRANAGKAMSEKQVIEFVETRRRPLAVRRISSPGITLP